MLRKIHKEICNVEEPWWRKVDAEEAYHSTERDAAADQLDHDAYAAGRKQYLKDTGATPPNESNTRMKA